MLDNLQAPEKADPETGSLDIVDIWPTIQGEGPFAGRPSVFIRLAGCNLQCRKCDTDYTKNRRRIKIEDIYQHACALQPGLAGKGPGIAARGLFVLTGGEPFRQDIAPLCKKIHSNGGIAQIETNGTLAPNMWQAYWARIVCSPKTPTVSQFFAKHCWDWKYVLSAGHVDIADGLPTEVLGMPYRVARPLENMARQRNTVYVQPCDDQDEAKNKANIQAAVDSAMEHNYTLCLQMHKYAGVK